MAQPIIELISETIVSRLQNITVSNGYEFTVSFAKLVDRNKNQWTPEPLGIYVQEVGIEEVPELSYPGNPPRKAFDATFEITGFAGANDIEESEVGKVDPSVTEWQMIAAITKAIGNSDAAGWHTFGGYAFNANVSSASRIDAPGYDAARVVLNVMYRTEEINPYSQ